LLCITTTKEYFNKLLEEEFIHDYNYVSATEIEDIREFLADLDLDDYTVLVIDDAQNLSLDDFREIFKYYLTNRTLNVIFVGNRNLKQKLNSFKFKSIRAGLNFILELKPLQNFNEFEQFVKYYTSENGISVHFTKGALKYIYKKTGGRIKEIIDILDKLKDKKFITSLHFEKKKAIIPIAGTVVAGLGLSYVIVLEAEKLTKILKEENKTTNLTNKNIDKTTLEKIKQIKEKDQQILKIAKNSPNLLEKRKKEQQSKNCSQGSSFLVGECKAETIEKNPKPSSKNSQISPPKKVYKYAIFLGVFRSEKSARYIAKKAYKLTGEKPVIKKVKGNLNKVIIFINSKEKLKKIMKILKNTKQFKDAYFREGNFTI
jgi:cell division septation protein DedD